MEHLSHDDRRARPSSWKPATVLVFDMFGASNEILCRVPEDRTAVARRRLPDDPHERGGVLWQWPVGALPPVPLRLTRPRPDGAHRRAQKRPAPALRQSGHGIGAALVGGWLGGCFLTAAALGLGLGWFTAALAYFLGASATFLALALWIAEDSIRSRRPPAQHRGGMPAFAGVELLGQ